MKPMNTHPYPSYARIVRIQNSTGQRERETRAHAYPQTTASMTGPQAEKAKSKNTVEKENKGSKCSINT
jgi:hypothetical protein